MERCSLLAQLNTPIKVKGANGQDLISHWGETSPAAYLGTTIPGFPNFFMLLGLF
jgi:4-hydroxyacetophenone monooxygenase